MHCGDAFEQILRELQIMFKNIVLKNIIRRGGRSIGLMLLALLMSLAVFAGTLMITGLQGGLNSLESRLGADIMIVPYEATTKADVSTMSLLGNAGYYYMDKSNLDKVRNTEGVAQCSMQLFIASAKASCCSLPLQIIAFDPETDFTIQPWVSKSFDGVLNDKDVIIGADVASAVGREITFYDVPCTVVAQLDRTGTYLDNAVYTSKPTTEILVESARSGKNFDFNFLDLDNSISCILVNVAEGYDTTEVLNDLNIHLRKAVAIKMTDMVDDVSGGISDVAGLIGVLMIFIWILSIVIMLVVYAMMANERKKEFAILRVVGASRKKLNGIVAMEAGAISLAGAIIGALVGGGLFALFTGLIEAELDVPFLIPDAGTTLLLAVISIVVSAVVGILASFITAGRISKSDAGIILREEK